MANDLGNKDIFAKNLTSLMNQKGIGRQRLATDLGFPYTTVTDWLKGKTYPRIDKIEMMSRYFHCEKSDLIERHDLSPNIVTTSESVFMNSVDFVKQICRERHIPLSRVERELGFANGYIGQLKKGSFPSDRLTSIAEYLNVSPNFILNCGLSTSSASTLTDDETKLLNYFRDMNEEGQEELLKHARLLTASGLYIKSNSPRMVEGA